MILKNTMISLFLGVLLLVGQASALRKLSSGSRSSKGSKSPGTPKSPKSKSGCNIPDSVIEIITIDDLAFSGDAGNPQPGDVNFRNGVNVVDGYGTTIGEANSRFTVFSSDNNQITSGDIVHYLELNGYGTIIMMDYVDHDLTDPNQSSMASVRSEHDGRPTR